jgi:hypothetical protein
MNDDIKAACVERFNRTLKTRMFRYFTARHTNRWLDVLQSLIESYNKSIHRSIGMAPNDVTRENSDQDGLNFTEACNQSCHAWVDRSGWGAYKRQVL